MGPAEGKESVVKVRRKAAVACGATWVLALLAPAVATFAETEAAHAAKADAPPADEEAVVVVVPGSIGGPRYVPAVNDYFRPDTFRSRPARADGGAVTETTPAGESVGTAPAIAQRPAVLPLPTGLALGAAGLGTLAGLRAGRRMIALSRMRVRSK